MVAFAESRSAVPARARFSPGRPTGSFPIRSRLLLCRANLDLNWRS